MACKSEADCFKYIKIKKHRKQVIDYLKEERDKTFKLYRLNLQVYDSKKSCKMPEVDELEIIKLNNELVILKYFSCMYAYDIILHNIGYPLLSNLKNIVYLKNIDYKVSEKDVKNIKALFEMLKLQ